ncbi:MAG: hypothetical protein JWO15_424 [Sphingomonadales bacterium]|nr:hypothetical protein [Sphingomonadales bacterium]
MNRTDAVLAILASANGLALSPVQLQKAAFLLDKNGLVAEGPRFNFVPYDYGPFDRSVYDEASALAMQGLSSISPSPSGRWNVYSATPVGVERGVDVLANLPDNLRTYVRDVTNWVRGQSFASLVKSIYQQYPEMKANSIFQD